MWKEAGGVLGFCSLWVGKGCWYWIGPLRPVATLRSNAKAPLSSCEPDAVSGLSFSKWSHPPLDTSLPASLSFTPPTCFYSFSVSHFLISFSSFCLQLPSPTAMSTALRGISCYLREVTTRLLSFGQRDPPSVCLSVLIVQFQPLFTLTTMRLHDWLQNNPLKQNIILKLWE